MTFLKYIIGLDVGIGSVGWAVIRNEENCKRIEDFGVRIFDSSESGDEKNRKSYAQQRREYRGTRRNQRRRVHRRERLKNYIQEIGLTTKAQIAEFFKDNSHDVIELRAKALDEKITPEELSACLMHIAKHRGYKPFYEVPKDDKKSDEGKNQLAMKSTADIIEKGNYRSIAEAITKDSYFKEKVTNRKKYRNSKDNNNILFPTKMYEKEVYDILNKQAEYYPCLTQKAIEDIWNIIFSRRDFEDGPGDVNDNFRPYKGFYDSIGNCQFYPDKPRGFRFSVIGDLFALVNKLSQFRYVNSQTGEVIKVPNALMDKIIDTALINGSITKKDINAIAKNLHFEIITSGNDDGKNIADCFKYIKVVKPIFEEYGFDWKKLISENYLDINSLLNRIGETLSKNITPSRRINSLKKIPEISDNDSLINKLARQQFSGTANVSNEFMIDTINAFINGKLSGEFEAEVLKDKFSATNGIKYEKLPPFDANSEYAKNPVVFRAINEARKIVNAIVDRYGVPNALNIEVSKDLNTSSKKRNKIKKGQQDNRKKRENAIKVISELLKIEESEVKPGYIDRYILGETQGWKCLYSGKDISNKEEAIKNENKTYEIDHIVPFSLILDDTLNNKALVIAEENQNKGNRVPLMYLEGEKRTDYIKNVNKLMKDKVINKTKYAYLMLETLKSEEAEKLLNNWKTRNLNDTRYISKFLVKYFTDNLKFNREKSDERRPEVYAVKGAITSMLRRQWLNKETWGEPDKSKLKDITYFDHAVDAIVIANCTPAMVIITAENRKLRDIYYDAGKVRTEEYERSLNRCVDTLMKFYGISPKVSRPMLEYLKETPSLIKNLRLEVECRVRDQELMKHFINECQDKSEEEIEEMFRADLRKFYYDDLAFANSIEMPIVSIKPKRKYSGAITDDNVAKAKSVTDPLSIKTIGENNHSALVDNKYYCVEVYETLKSLENKSSGKSTKTLINLQGIKRNHIVHKDKKLYLKPTYKYPEDYGKHIMYLFYGDYLEITRTKDVRRGYYLFANNINQNSLCFTRYNNRRDDKGRYETINIGQKASIKKISVDILGKKGGVIRKHGEPLSLLPEKN